MAAGNFVPYAKFVFHTQRQAFDFLGATIKALLLANAHTPNMNGHEFLSDIVANEIADAGYVRQSLSGKTITQDGSNRTVYDADDVDFGNAVSLTARYMALFLDTTVAGTSKLMGLIDLNNGGSTAVSSTNSDFDIGFNAAGIYRITP